MVEPTRVTVGVVIVNNDGQVLMQLRDDKPEIMDPACWAVPGGEQDPGKSLEETARREILEETDYQLGDFKLVLERDLDRGNGLIEHQAYFLSQYDGVQAVHCLEGQSLEFMNPDRLGSLKLTPGLGPIIAYAIAAT